MGNSLSVKAFKEFKDGNYEKALKLYQELEVMLATNAFNYNIQACLKKIGVKSEIQSPGEICTNTRLVVSKSISKIEIKNKSFDEYYRDTIDLLDLSKNNILIYIAQSLDCLSEIDIIERVNAAKSKNCKAVLLLGVQPVDLVRASDVNEVFDEIYFKPFRANDQFWINYILNCNEFANAVVINPKEFRGASRLKIGSVDWGRDSANFAFANGILCSYFISHELLKEHAGFLLPFENKFSCYEYFQRLQGLELIANSDFYKIKKCINFEENDLLSLEVLKRWIESSLERTSGIYYKKAIEDTESYKLLPDTILGGAREIVDFYTQGNRVKVKVNLFCFNEYLERGGITGRVKNDDILSIDGADNITVMPLSNYENSQDKASIYERGDALHYVDLLPLRNYEITDIEGLKASGKIPLITTVPVVRKLKKEKYSINEWIVPEETTRFGMISACFNNSKTLISSLISVLGQSVKNLELVVVDDNSSDNSLELISGFLSLFPYVSSKIISKESNTGVYPCRNTAIIKSKSEYLFGQDLDDHSSPQRVYVSNILYRSKKVDFIVCNHARMDSSFNILSMKKGDEPLKTFRKGLMTWHTERKNFFEYGMFLSVRKSGDSEFFDRLKRLSVNKVFELDQNLYYALMDNVNESRLTSDIFKMGLERSPLIYRFEGSDSRFDFENKYKEIHKKHGLGFNFRFGRSLETNSTKIVASMATIPGREHQLAQSINSILHQVDRLNLFLNGEIDFSVSKLEDLVQDKKIKVYMSSEIGDLRDNAKFFTADKLSQKSYYLTLDDDLVYPIDYVDTLLYKSQIYSDMSVLTVHGYRLWESVQSIHTDKLKRGRYYHFKERLDYDVKVNVAGTGTVFIPPGVTIKSFNEPPFGMVDIVFANYCANKKVDIIAVDREQRWVTEAIEKVEDKSKSKPQLYKENQKEEREALICAYVKEIQSQHLVANIQAGKGKTQIINSIKTYFSDKSDHLSLGSFERKVYICCTGFNYSGYAIKFARSLWQALRVTNYDNVTVLAYDDCSSDGSADKLRTYFEQNLTAWNWEIFEGQENKGPAFGRSFLFDQVQDEDAICIFLDSDDEVESGLIRRIICEYLQSPNILGTFGGWKFNDKIKKTWPSHIQSELTSLGDIVGKFKFGHPRSFVKAVYNGADKRFLFGPDGEWLKYCSDLGLYLSILSSSDISKLRRIDEVLYKYNVGTENGTINRFGSNKAVMRDYLFGLVKL